MFKTQENLKEIKHLQIIKMKMHFNKYMKPASVIEIQINDELDKRY